MPSETRYFYWGEVDALLIHFLSCIHTSIRHISSIRLFVTHHPPPPPPPQVEITQKKKLSKKEEKVFAKKIKEKMKAGVDLDEDELEYAIENNL